MARKIYKTPVVVLDGFQSILQPGKFGYGLEAIIPEEIVDELEKDRGEALNWAVSKLKNPKRSTLKPEPWEEVSPGQFKLKFRWDDEKKPPVVDTVGQLVHPDTAIYSGSKVKLAFEQKPYILKDGVTYGTSCKLVGVQLIELQTGAGVDRGNLSAEDVAALFGATEGFTEAAPAVADEPELVAAEF